MLKYGGPTETPRRSNASRKIGYSVPSMITAIAATSSTLFISRNDSREIGAKPAFDVNSDARHAYSTSAPPMQITRNARMNRPRAGSLANACTDSTTPERTRNVPSSDSENAAIASSSVQLLNSPRFSVTASE